MAIYKLTLNNGAIVIGQIIGQFNDGSVKNHFVRIKLESSEIVDILRFDIKFTEVVKTDPHYKAEEISIVNSMKKQKEKDIDKGTGIDL